MFTSIYSAYYCNPVRPNYNDRAYRNIKYTDGILSLRFTKNRTDSLRDNVMYYSKHSRLKIIREYDYFELKKLKYSGDHLFSVEKLKISQFKMWTLKTRERKTSDREKCRGGKRRTGKRRTKSHGWKTIKCCRFSCV